MPSVIEDFDFIAKRASEIRMARYHELGVSPPAAPAQPQPSTQQAAPAPKCCDGLRYAPGFENLAGEVPPPTDDWDCCFPA